MAPKFLGGGLGGVFGEQLATIYKLIDSIALLQRGPIYPTCMHIKAQDSPWVHSSQRVSTTASVVETQQVNTRFYLLSRAHQTDFCLVSTQIQLSQAAYGFMIRTAHSGNSTTINARAQV